MCSDVRIKIDEIYNNTKLTHSPLRIFRQPKAVITVTIVAILKILHSAALTVNFKL